MATSFAMASTLANRLVDGDKPYIRVKRWLSKITHVEKPTSSLYDYEPSISDSATLYTERPRTLSNASEDSLASIQPYQAQPAALINSAQVDVAIALAVRARQEDRAGNAQAASGLFVAALERMALAVQDIGRVENVNTRERLTTLKLLLESSCHLDPTHNPQIAKLLSAEQPTAAVGQDSSDISLRSGSVENAQLAENLRATLVNTLATAMGLFNQAMILWLMFLGNMFVWAAVQFKNSRLPELLGQLIVQLAAWTYGLGVQFKVHEHAVVAGQHVLGWAVQLDKKTHFSGRLWFAAASMLSALARVVEESSAAAKAE